MITLFDPLEVDEQAFMIAAHMPVGRVWESTFDPLSNMGKLIRGFGVEIYRLEVLTQKISNEIDINQASELLEEWERSVGLPDSCFFTNISIEERRKQVLQKFSNFGGVQKAEDFVRVAAIFGFNIQIITGLKPGGFPLEFPITFFEDTKAAVHTIFVEMLGIIEGDIFFPLPFPIPFSLGGKSFLQCIFDKLAPANTQVIIVNEGEI
jgi:uncharacterized protein YmfQ (DUF2313 family)